MTQQPVRLANYLGVAQLRQQLQIMIGSPSRIPAAQSLCCPLWCDHHRMVMTFVNIVNLCYNPFITPVAFPDVHAREADPNCWTISLESINDVRM